MEKIEARFIVLESSVEIPKKVTSELGSHIAEIKKIMEDVGEIKEMLGKWMQKQGITLDEEKTNGKKVIEGEAEGGGIDDEVETPHSWMKKKELPTFEGSDPLGWVARVEKFFEVQQVKPSAKLRLAFISMVHWFQF